MRESPGKSAFEKFVPELDVGPYGALVGASQTSPTDEQVQALERLRAWEGMAQGAYPLNTVRVWRADWRALIQFCVTTEASPLPASPNTVRDYVQHCVAEVKKPATIRRYLATIARASSR